MAGIPWLGYVGAGAARCSVLMASVVLLIPNRALPQDTTALPTALYRRVAEVADGQRLAGSVFVVLRRTFPHHVAGIFTTRAAANAFRARLPRFPDLVIVGPVRPTLDPWIRERWFAGGCVHNTYTTVMRDGSMLLASPMMDSALSGMTDPGVQGASALISDSMSLAMSTLGYCGREWRPASEVVSVTITTKMRDSTTTTVVYPARTIDAAFFTVDAVDKFVISYYAKLFGAAAAASMREDILRGLRTPQ